MPDANRTDANRTAETKPPRRIAGHALKMTWSGEYGAESSSTGTCRCGRWEESAGNQDEVRFEYRAHLRRAWETSRAAAEAAEVGDLQPTGASRGDAR